MLKIVRDYKSDKLNIFATKSYLAIKSQNYGWFINDDFVLAYFVCKKLCFKYIIFPSQTIYLKQNLSTSDEKNFLNEVINKIKNDLKYIDFIAQSPTNVVFKAFPNNAIFCNFGSYQIDLMQNEEKIFNNIHSKHRNVIKKALKDGVYVLKGLKYMNEAIDIINNTLIRQNLSSISKNIYYETKMLDKNIEFYISSINNSVQGAAIIYYNKQCAYYMYGGSVEKPHTGALNLMHWEIIKDLKQKNVQIYDLVGARIHTINGSKLEGIQRFKSRFSTSMSIGYLWKYPINLFKYRLFNCVKFLYFIGKFKKLSKDVIDQEIKIKKIYLTFDYELFFGKSSGSLEKCVLNPTNELLNELKKHRILATFFIDAIYIEKLLEYKLFDDYIAIKKQIQQMVMQGHRVELHLHTHWYDAKRENGEWIFSDYSHYRIHSYSQEEIERIFDNSTKILYDIILEVDKNYKLQSYRAGGWCIEPFEKIKNSLKKHSLFYDSSAIFDVKSSSKIHHFDFSNIPNKCFYRFSDNVYTENLNGEFVEIPTSVFYRGLIFKILNKILLKFSDSKIFGNGSGLSANKPSLFERFKKAPRIFSLESISSHLINSAIKKSKNRHIVFTSHPKSLSKESLKCIERMANKHIFLTFKDIEI